MSWTEFREHVWPFKDRLYRLALKVVGDTAEAEDVVQEVLVKIWKQGTDLSLINNIEAWCLRLTRNHAIDKLRGGYRKRKTDFEHAPELTSAKAQQPDQQVEMQDTVGQIRQLMQELPENQRMVMHLRDIEGQTYQEIAEALEMSMPQVKTNLFRARKAIRAALVKTQSYGL